MKNNKKMIILIMILICLFFLYCAKNRERQILNIKVDNNNNLVIILPQNGQEIKEWIDEDGTSFFFLPSYVSEKCKIKVVRDQYDIFQSDIEKKDLIYNKFYSIQYIHNKKNEKKTICFKKSSNIYTMNIDLGNRGVDDIEHDMYMNSQIKLFNQMGVLEYNGEDEYMKGHGNSTWNSEKRSYLIKLSSSSSLCKMDKGKKWLLLSNVMDGTKMLNKMVYDFGKQIGLQYCADSDWVDLYVNGEYQGNYLLCEKLEVSDNRINIEELEKENEKCNIEGKHENYQDEDNKGYIIENNPDNISGGYLIEKDVDFYYEDEDSGFQTRTGYCFSVKYPQIISKEEITYLQDYFQNIEDLIYANDESYQEYIDLVSFTKRFIVEQMVLNYDSYITSCYFYKRKNDDKLYAGPLWDYDNSCGEALGPWMDYEVEIDSLENRNIDQFLDWDMVLLKDSNYIECMKEEYKKMQPVIQKLVSYDIDNYYNRIKDSVSMDMIRWDYGKNLAGHYYNYENNIRYLKFFLNKRINIINNFFGYPRNEEEKGTGEIHNIICLYEGEEIVIPIEDGKLYNESNLNFYDEERYWGWKYQRDKQGYCDKLPIYEDIILLPCERD